MSPSFFFADYAVNDYLFYSIIASCLSGPIFGFFEFTENGLKYSKFATESASSSFLGSIPSKLAMFLYYAPAAAISGLVLSQVTLNFPGIDFIKPQPSWRFLALATALFVHFSKRVLEVLFLHKYSGNAELLSSAVVIFIYTFTSAHLLYTQQLCEGLTPPSVNLLWPGLVLFLVGISGNFYHHYLLAQLRSKDRKNQKQRYVIPHGGLFELVACPHYLFEIIDFCGLAMISQTVTSLFTFILVAIYLTSRSISTKRWYLRKIDGFPKNRKAIIPFLL